jgi:farnesyl diphosphate synthase
MSDFGAWVAAKQARCEAALERILPAAETLPTHLHVAMRYAVLGGGKRLRPLLVYAAGELSGAAVDRLDAAAAAVELIHAYSLVHDDMPCMDDDAIRRGKPTVHVAHGEATALLVGDALQSLAFEALALPAAGLSAAQQLEMCRRLARASGSNGMAGGQAIDLASVGLKLGRADLEQMHHLKTGALIRCAIALGDLAGAPNSARAAAIERYAEAVGLAFQVVDDVLDEVQSSAELGKTAGKDRAAGKPTFVSLLGLDSARALAERLLGDALAALEPYGVAAENLRLLARFVIERRH